MEASLLAALIAGVVSISVAVITGRLNKATVRAEKTLPPYDALALRVSSLEEEGRRYQDDLRAERARTSCLEEKVGHLEEDREEDREWIRRVIVVAEGRGALEQILPLPAWLDLESDSMKRRREES